MRGQDIGMSGGEGKVVHHYPHPPNVALYYSTGKRTEFNFSRNYYIRINRNIDEDDLNTIGK